MNAVNTETSRQFNRIGPDSLVVGMRAFTRNGGVYDDSTNTVRFDYARRKRRGQMLSDKCTVAVQYDRGSDLYNVTVTVFDGTTFESTDVYTAEGVYTGFFRDLKDFVFRATKGE